MALLGIDLQSGFDEDEVVIEVNGEERFRRGDVKTRRVLGLADHIRMEVDAGPVAIDVHVRDLHKHLDLDVEHEVYVGFSLEQDDIRVIVRDERFGYG